MVVNLTIKNNNKRSFIGHHWLQTCLRSIDNTQPSVRKSDPILIRFPYTITIRTTVKKDFPHHLQEILVNNTASCTIYKACYPTHTVINPSYVYYVQHHALLLYNSQHQKKKRHKT